MRQTEIEAYLNHLASRRSVSASTQSVALNAIAFLHREVLKTEVPDLKKLRRIKRYKTIPVVMSSAEVESTFLRMKGTTRLMAELIYGTGMRVNECITHTHVLRNLHTGMRDMHHNAHGTNPGFMMNCTPGACSAGIS